MGKKKIYLLVFGLIFLVVVSGFVWSWWVTRDIRKNTEEALNQGQSVEVKNLVLTETKDGKKYWELYAKTGNYTSEQGMVVLKEIIGNFYDKDENVTLSFQSPKGTYLENEKIITLVGQTLIVAKDGSWVTANKFVWRGQDENINAEGGVLINRNNEFVASAEKGIFNSKLTYFKIIGKSKTSVYDKLPELPTTKEVKK